MKFRIWIKRLHLYFALIGLVPIFVLTMTGIILIYRNSIDDFLTRDFHEISSPGTEKLSIADVRGRLAKAIPDYAILSVQLPSDPRKAYSFGVKKGEVWTTAYVDPYTGDYRGMRGPDEFSKANFISWITKLHMSFLVGRNGELASGISSLMLSFLALSGIILWWPRESRFTRQKFILKKAKRWKQTAWQLHPVLGFYSSLILLVVTLTGTYVTFYKPINRFIYTITSTPPEAEHTHTAWAGGLATISEEEAIENATRALKERFGVDMRPAGLSFPEDDNAVMEVFFEGDRGKAWADEWHVEVNAQTGEIVGTETPPQAPAASRALSWIGAIHFGSWGAVFGRAGDHITSLMWTFALVCVFFLMVSGLSIVKKSQWKKMLRMKN